MKVMTLLLKLDKTEHQKFEIYLNCPLHNTRIELNDLYKNMPLFEKDKDKIKAWRLNYITSNNITENEFRKRCHYLVEALYNFNIINELKSNDSLNIYLKFKVNKIKLGIGDSQKLYEQADSFFNSKIAKTSDELSLQFLLYKNLFLNNPDPKEQRKLLVLMKSTLIELNEYEDILINLEHSNLDFVKIPKSHLPETSKNPIIKIHKAISSLYKDGDIQENLSKIRRLITDHLDIPKPIVKDVIIKTTNFLITKLNEGDKTLNIKIWELYKLGLETKAIIPDLLFYRNISYLAIKALEFDWALNFIEDYKSRLPFDQQDSAYSFTKARIFINMKEWHQVIDTLRNVEYEDITYNLNSKLFLMISYLELDEYEALDSFIKSFKVFLRRRRNIPVARKNAFYDFTTVVDHLMKAGDRGDAKRLVKAREVLDSNAAIPNKDWLLEKIEEIEAVIKK